MSAPRTLQQWLDYQQGTHPDAIALGLDRVRELARRLDCLRPASRVLSVAGTNGKGSTVAFAESLARAAGLRVGCYTSPHLLRYNERIRIDGLEVSDEALCLAFEAIEAVRGEVPLTYFEWGTLAALRLLGEARLDLAVLEVGMGGRLDAVNVVDADAAVITTVALDHTEFLGRDREAIGREKAGILRRDRPLVLGELDPPDSVLQAAARGGARVLRRGRDFHAEDRPGGWRYRDREGAMELPPLPLAAPCQPANAATAIAALRALLPLDEASIRRGLAEVRIPGRMQRLPGPTEIVLDVAHNPQAAQMLARGLAARRPAGSTLAVFAALADKDAAALVGPLMGVVDAWHLAGLEGVGARAQPVEGLWPRIAGLLARVPCQRHATVVEALRAARADALPGDRIVVFGSFHTVAQALAELQAARD